MRDWDGCYLNAQTGGPPFRTVTSSPLPSFSPPRSPIPPVPVTPLQVTSTLFTTLSVDIQTTLSINSYKSKRPSTTLQNHTQPTGRERTSDAADPPTTVVVIPTVTIVHTETPSSDLHAPARFSKVGIAGIVVAISVLLLCACAGFWWLWRRQHRPLSSHDSLSASRSGS